MTLKTNFLAAAVAASAILLSANTSVAWFGHHGSCGSYGGGSCGSYGGSWGGWGSGGSYGGGYGSGGSCGSCGSYGGGGGYAYYGGYYGGGYARSGVIYDGVVSDSSSTSAYASAIPTVRTRLTIHVPADAKLTLAGVDTKQSGELRQFATNKLTAGQTWDGYKVVAEMQRDGKTLRQEQTIKLIGGEAQELSINFDSSNQVASN